MITFRNYTENLLIEQGRKMLYNRSKARILIGFSGKARDFSPWLREHEFIDWNDMPAVLLQERGLMYCHVKDIKGKKKYVNVPLFTEEGIKYFKALLKDPELIIKESEIIKSENKKHHIPII